MSVETGFALAAFRLRAEEFLRHITETLKIPGAVVAVSYEGNNALAFAGVSKLDVPEPLRAENRFQLGCLMKLLVSVVALELTAQGKLNLHRPIGQYLPESEDCIHGKTVQLAHLLSHTAGYRGLNVFEEHVRSLTWSDLVAFLHLAPQHFRSGAVYSYEHSETVLAAEIIQRATDKPLLDLARKMFLDALQVELRAASSDRFGEDVGQHGINPQNGALRRVDLPELSPDGKPYFSPIRARFRPVAAVTTGDRTGAYLGAALPFHDLWTARLPLEHFEKRHIGDVLSRSSSLDVIQRTLTVSFTSAVLDGLMVIVTLVVLFLHSRTLTWITLADVGLYALGRFLWYRPLRSAT